MNLSLPSRTDLVCMVLLRRMRLEITAMQLNREHITTEELRTAQIENAETDLYEMTGKEDHE